MCGCSLWILLPEMGNEQRGGEILYYFIPEKMKALTDWLKLFE